MPLEIKKKEKESVQSLLRRFQKAVQESGILIRTRKLQFKERKISEEKKKRVALYKEEKRKEYEKLKKLGKIK